MTDSAELLAYTHRLRRLTSHSDPDIPDAAADRIRQHADDLGRLEMIDRRRLITWTADHVDGVYVLGLTVGLSQEKLKNLLRAQFGSSSWTKIARSDPASLITWMDDEFSVVDSLNAQRSRVYSFGDIVVARASTRRTASLAGTAGLLIEDAVEAVVKELQLPYRMRGRFVGTNGRTAPADIAIPDFDECVIAIGCKGFDSTGSKLTAAVSEITEMVDVHRPHQYLMAVVDGIGWLSRMGDFRRMYDHDASHRIEGLYALADLDRFQSDLLAAAQRARILS